MMRVTIVAVGKLKEPHFREAAEEYLKRLGAYARVDVTEVPDRDVSGDEARAVREEADDILRSVPDGAHVVLLDEGGKQTDSVAFSEWLGDLMVGGTSHVAFVVGGTAGVDGRVRAAASRRLSLSEMTLPHQLARVVLLEQVYRALRIMRGEPYHR